MHRAVYFFLATVFFLSCQSSNQNVLREIKELEYRRTVDGTKFVGWLNSKDPKIRETAVESLGRIQDTTTISWVANRLSDKNDSVRYKAAFAIGQFFSTKAEEPVLSFLPYEKNTIIRYKLTEALGKVGSAKSFPLIRNAIESIHPIMQQTGAIGFAMLAYRGYPPFEYANSLSSLLLSTNDPDVRWRCAYGLYRCGSLSEFKPLIESISFQDPMTRYFSLKAQAAIIGYLRSPSAKIHQHTELFQSAAKIIHSNEYEILLQQCLRDSIWFVRLAALQVCEALTPSKLITEVKSLCADQNEQVRATAIQTLAAYQHPDALSFLNTIFENGSDWREKGMALQQLAQRRPKEALNKIKHTISELKWPATYYHIQALEQIENPEATRMLQQLAESDEKAQLTLVLESLANRSGVPISLFLDKLKLYDPIITTIVAEKFARLADSSLVPPLVEAYDHFTAPNDLEPMLAILSALDSIPHPISRSLLEKEAQSPYSSIRKTARKALIRLYPNYQFAQGPDSLPTTRYHFPIIQNNFQPRVRFSTNKGEFIMVLFTGKAPITVSNFMELVNKGFYNGIYFHRVVPGFVVQAGDPRGDGWGGPGYTIPCEYNDLFYERGMVGMAHAGKDTGGSQFFITQTPQPHLNGRHTAFGKIISGMEVVDRLEIYDMIIKAELIQ